MNIELPNDVWKIIFSALSVKDLCNISLVSHKFYMLSKSVWTSPDFDNLENRISISKKYVTTVVNADLWVHMMNSRGITFDNLGGESYKDELAKICIPLVVQESVNAASQTFTFHELASSLDSIIL
jgi:hypothetical protein